MQKPIPDIDWCQNNLAAAFCLWDREITSSHGFTGWQQAMPQGKVGAYTKCTTKKAFLAGAREARGSWHSGVVRVHTNPPETVWDLNDNQIIYYTSVFNDIQWWTANQPVRIFSLLWGLRQAYAHLDLSWKNKKHHGCIIGEIHQENTKKYITIFPQDGTTP